MKIFIASDHAGYELKEKLIEYLVEENGNEIIDKGAFEYNESDDYPDFVSQVAEEISKDPENSRGIVLGGSGQGEATVCNRFKGVRAVVYYGGNQEIIGLSRQHNDANILSLGARFLSEEEAKEVVKVWLSTAFSEGDRHIRRIKKIEKNFDDFDKWNKVKKSTNNQQRIDYFKEGDIFYMKEGKNVGFEQNGKGINFVRPVLVLRKFNNSIFWGLPLTNVKKEGIFYHSFVVRGKEYNVILSQLRLLDSKRFVRRKLGVPKKLFAEIKEKTRALMHT